MSERLGIQISLIRCVVLPRILGLVKNMNSEDVEESRPAMVPVEEEGCIRVRDEHSCGNPKTRSRRRRLSTSTRLITCCIIKKKEGFSLSLRRGITPAHTAFQTVSSTRQQ